MENPLKKLIDLLGLDADRLERKVGCNHGYFYEALSDSDTGSVAAFCAIAKLLGVKWTIPTGQPLAIWISNESVHSLNRDDTWRSNQGLSVTAKTRGELRAMIRRLDSEGRTYGEIVAHLQDNWVPTAEGHRGWRRSTIGQTLKGKDSPTDAQVAVVGNDLFMDLWRRHVTDMLMSRLFDFSQIAMVEFGATPVCSGGRVIVQTHRPIPAFVREWVIRNMKDIAWFTPDQWGVFEDDDRVPVLEA